MEIITALFAFVFLTASMSVTGCPKADQTQRQWQQEECLLGTDSDNAITFHTAIYYPDELRPFEEGFLVGIEKAPKKILGESSYGADLETMQDGYADVVGRLKNDSKQFFISHVIEYPAQPISNAQGETSSKPAYSRSLYNIYAELRNTKLRNKPDEASVLKDNWDVIKKLQDAVSDRIASAEAEHKPYTHLILLSMGWNTPQEEAVRNFRSISLRLGETRVVAEKTPFRPLYIGVTWPSDWGGSAAKTLASYSNKSHDADELGLSWLSAIVKNVVAPYTGSGKLGTVVIGHSFGARTTSMAVCSDGAFGKKYTNNGKIDLLIGLEGAYSFNRFTGGGKHERIAYPGIPPCERAGHIVLSTSKHDSAVSKAIWAPMTGEAKTYERVCQDESAFDCMKVSGDGKLVTAAYASDRHIHLLEASDLIKYNAYGSGSGAHSDIYRSETAVMLRQAICQFAPPSPQSATKDCTVNTVSSSK